MILLQYRRGKIFIEKELSLQLPPYCCVIHFWMVSSHWSLSCLLQGMLGVAIIYTFPNFNLISWSKAYEMLMSLSKMFAWSECYKIFKKFIRLNRLLLGMRVRENYWGRTCVKMQMVIFWTSHLVSSPKSFYILLDITHYFPESAPSTTFGSNRIGSLSEKYWIS